MKKLITILFFISLVMTKAQAFSLSDFTGSSKEEAGEESTNINFDAIKSQLMAAFEDAKPQLKNQVSDALSAYAEKKDIPFLKELKKIQEANLTPKQTAILSAVKNDLMAAVVDRNFSFENAKSSSIVTTAVNSLKSGDIEGLSNAFTNLKKTAELTDAQKNILDLVTENATPLVTSSVDSLLKGFKKD